MEKMRKFCWGMGLMLLVMACSSGESDEYIDRMDKEHEGDAPVKNEATKTDNQEMVSGEEVQYATVNGTEVTGYLSQPEEAGDDRPGLIVIHEWWGLNDNIRMMTDKLAGEGYTALAVDLYKGKVAESPDSAGTLAGSVNEEEAIDNLDQAYNYLVKQQDIKQVGTIGWCFGGGWSLQTALAMPDDIDATVIYYGNVVTDADELVPLDMPILGIFGAEDEGIPPEQVKSFESALNESDISNDIHIYEGADHAFANPSGTRYDKEAAENAWQKTVSFLAKHLK